MKGHIFNLLEEFIEESAGLGMLQKILDRCSFDTSVGFVRTESYPDEVLIEVVSIASDMLGLTVEEAQFAFGEWIFPKLVDLIPQSYSEFEHPSAFLATVDHIHKVELKKLYPDAIPPVFSYKDIDNSHALLTYNSQRKMFPLVDGVLQGVAKHYKVGISTSIDIGIDGDDSVAHYNLTYSEASS